MSCTSLHARAIRNIGRAFQAKVREYDIMQKEINIVCIKTISFAKLVHILYFIDTLHFSAEERRKVDKDVNDCRRVTKWTGFFASFQHDVLYEIDSRDWYEKEEVISYHLSSVDEIKQQNIDLARKPHTE
jgi:hypothetical protein